VDLLLQFSTADFVTIAQPFDESAPGSGVSAMRVRDSAPPFAIRTAFLRSFVLLWQDAIKQSASSAVFPFASLSGASLSTRLSEFASSSDIPFVSEFSFQELSKVPCLCWFPLLRSF
jgi:hypothetical protein